MIWEEKITKRKNGLQNNFIIDKNDLCYEEDVEEISLSPANNTLEGALVSSFNFSQDSPIKQCPEPNLNTASEKNLEDNRKTKTVGNVATPLVAGEPYSISRFYKLRYSTAKMLNEIKAAHSDVNVYMNTIVDEAIRHYYSFTFEKR